MSDLARALVAHPNGPKHDTLSDELTVANAPGGWPRHRAYDGIVWQMDPEAGSSDAWIPDLADPATAGVLLVQLFEADPSMHVHRDGDGYIVHVAPGVCERSGRHLGEAVAKALLAVWAPTLSEARPGVGG